MTWFLANAIVWFADQFGALWDSMEATWDDMAAGWDATATSANWYQSNPDDWYTPE